MRTVATAGHVDHGKSSLVLALTGTNPDRFPEERGRGLTIDLGFAFCTLPSGAEVAFVDVPGHVRFIRNMLAGVGAIDVVVLVVAATEGWMPQTEEHVRILDVLGVGNGIVAITKADLVDDETLALVHLDVEERLAGSSLAGLPIVACDSVLGRGLDDVAGMLDGALARAPAAADRGRARLWIDRVFAATGAGTVVTGTLTRGRVTTDTEVEVGEPPQRVRVRAVESAGRRVPEGLPGTRVALNLVGIEHRALSRGDAVVAPGRWERTRVLDVALTPLPGAPLPSRGRLQAYVGSGEHAVWFRGLDPAGRFARLRFETPLPLAFGDRIVLRDPGRRTTVAGAEILDLDPTTSAKDAAALLALPFGARLLATRPWLRATELARLTASSDDDAFRTARSLVDDGVACELDGWLIDPPTLEQTRTAARVAVHEHHATSPHEPGLELSVLATRLGLTPEQTLVVLSTSEDLEVARGVVRDVRHGAAGSTPEARRLVAALEAAPFAPPAPAELGAPPGLVRALIREGQLIDLDGVVFTAGALGLARERVVAMLRDRGSVTVADVRDALGSTRKYVVPIVGWLDRNGVTRRRGDDRVPGPTSGLDGVEGAQA